MIRSLQYIKRILFCTSIILLAFAMQTFAQLKFSAIANETKIGLNDLVQVQYKIENAKSVQHIEPPSFENFYIVSGPNQETGMSSINGQVSSYAAISYILKPKKSGSLTIEPATARADGKQLKCNPLIIQVAHSGSVAGRSPQPTAPPPSFTDPFFDKAPVNDYILKPGENADAKIKKNLFIKLIANKTTCYVGEPIVVSFNLYTRLRSETNVTEAPSFNGFSVSDLDVNQNATQEKIDGRLFSCYVLRKVQLYPLQSGTFTLTPVEAVNNVTFLKYHPHSNQGNDLLMQFMQGFGGNILSPEDYIQKAATLQSNALTILVKPLPANSVPPTFRGAVGNFSIQTNLDKEQLTTDDAGNLQIKILGSGNFNMINAPSVQWPTGIDAYDPKIKEHINQQEVPLQGYKIFNIPFTTSKPGSYSIPPVYFSWFNPKTGKYESGKTEPIAFQISKGKKVVPADKKTAGQTNIFLSISSLEWIGGGILVGGLLIAFIFMFIKRKNKESDLLSQVRLDDLKSQQEEAIVPGNPLADVHEKLMSQDAEGFYRELRQALESYLSHKLKLPVNTLSKDAVMLQLDSCNVGVGTTRLFESLMQEIELGLYARHSHVSQMRNLYEKTAELVSLLNKQIC